MSYIYLIIRFWRGLWISFYQILSSKCEIVTGENRGSHWPNPFKVYW
jgi:hypothetical protein